MSLADRVAQIRADRLEASKQAVLGIARQTVEAQQQTADLAKTLAQQKAEREQASKSIWSPIFRDLHAAELLEEAGKIWPGGIKGDGYNCYSAGLYLEYPFLDVLDVYNERPVYSGENGYYHYLNTEVHNYRVVLSIGVGGLSYQHDIDSAKAANVGEFSAGAGYRVTGSMGSRYKISPRDFPESHFERYYSPEKINEMTDRIEGQLAKIITDFPSPEDIKRRGKARIETGLPWKLRVFGYQGGTNYRDSSRSIPRFLD